LYDKATIYLTNWLIVN